MNYRCVAILVLALGVGAGAQGVSLDMATGSTIDRRPLIEGACCTRWNFRVNRLVYMAPDARGFYRVYTCRPDGTDRRDVCTNPALPTKHIGLPYWEPSGRYILVGAEKQEWSGARMFGSPDYGALPGFGVHDDLWVITADGSGAWKLTNEPNVPTEGELIPVFSPDGKRVAWSSRQADKTYIIKVADFVETPQAHLENVREYRPGGKAYYELGSFTSDSGGILYTSDQDTHSFWLCQIYRLDLASGRGLRLTHERWAYNEHPIDMVTAGGEWVVYMSTRGNRRFGGKPGLGTDWWAMRLDGSGSKRLTTMNESAESPEYEGGARWACTSAISPNGQFMLGDLQDSIVTQTSNAVVVRFRE